MRIDRNKYIGPFIERNLPIWLCPHCNDGTLNIKKDTFRYYDISRADAMLANLEGYPVLNKRNFSGTFKCLKQNCLEEILVSGIAHTELVGYEQLMGEDGPNGFVPDYAIYFEPRYFSIPINFIPLLTNYPETINNLLNAAFKLYWLDTASSANKIRSAVEWLMDFNGIEKRAEKASGRSGKFLNLYDRIKIFETRINKHAGHCFNGTRVIGNQGSHADDELLTKEELLDAFEMVKQGLDTIYDTTAKDLSTLATTYLTKAEEKKLGVRAVSLGDKPDKGSKK